MGEFTWLPAVGNLAGVLVVMYFGLKYISKRDEDMKGLMDRVEAMDERHLDAVAALKTDFLAGLKECNAQNIAITTTLFTLSRETVQTMASLSTRVGELGLAIQELRTEVGKKQDRTDNERKP